METSNKLGSALEALSQHDKVPEKEEVGVTHAHLNQAGELLMSMLHEGIQTNIKYFLDRQGLQLWQWICGTIVQAHNSGTLASSVIDNNWRSDVPVAPTKSFCCVCGAEFKPKNMGQDVCGSACGTKKFQAQWKKIVEEREKRDGIIRNTNVNNDTAANRSIGGVVDDSGVTNEESVFTQQERGNSAFSDV